MKFAVVAYFFLVVAAFVGWVLNIIAIVSAVHGSLTTLLVLRIVGIFVAPLGSILGYVA